MGIRDKFGLPANPGESSSEEAKKNLEEAKKKVSQLFEWVPELNKTVSKLDKKISKLDKKVSELNEAVARERQEVFELKQQLQKKFYLIEVMEPYVRNGVINEIEGLLKSKEDDCKEAAYRKFFSDDRGFLYLFADMLSGLNEMLRTGSKDRNEVIKFYGRNFSLISNNLIILEKTVESEPAMEDLSSMSLQDLVGLRNSLSSPENICENSQLFYTALWKSIEKLISLICSQEFEDSISNDQKSFDTLSQHILSLRKTLKQNGIKIVAHPTVETKNMFKPAATDEIPSKPLIYREKDGFVYTYGVLNDIKPYILDD
ncbi:MAG: hypothetical protein K2H47_07345 [Muribaculaceae bacterium]|nr:hypothetical protein [Muribaculaceae bacterium]